MAFSTAKRFWYIPVHEIARCLIPSKSIAIPKFHACTGCDMVASLGTKGKKTACITRINYEEVTSTFFALYTGPAHIIKDDDITLLERFTILL